MFVNSDALLKVIRSFHSFVQAVDRADTHLFRFIPSRLKRHTVRRFFRFFAPYLGQPASSNQASRLELNGLTLEIPHQLNYAYVLREYEPKLIHLLQEYLQPGMAMVDVGANIGFVTAFAARLVGNHGRVIAVEPGQDNLRFLRKNIELNGLSNVEIVPYAAGNKAHRRQLYLHSDSTSHTLFPPEGENDHSIEVQAISLDGVVTQPIDFVKIDVEGAEIEVLEGMTQILQQNPNLRLLVEWNPHLLQRAGYSIEALPQYLLEKGFAISLIDEESSLSSVEEAINLYRTSQLSRSWFASLYAYLDENGI
ncbi:MAG: FkbM family methyltransferase [Anaerolineae bacterium]|nr:FkbM family methyltransferase [Anaerolineae bacterium]